MSRPQELTERQKRQVAFLAWLKEKDYEVGGIPDLSALLVLAGADRRLRVPRYQAPSVEFVNPATFELDDDLEALIDRGIVGSQPENPWHPRDEYAPELLESTVLNQLLVLSGPELRGLARWFLDEQSRTDVKRIGSFVPDRSEHGQGDRSQPDFLREIGHELIRLSRLSARTQRS